jgi:hypothetical protein
MHDIDVQMKQKVLCFACEKPSSLCPVSIDDQPKRDVKYGNKNDKKKEQPTPCTPAGPTPVLTLDPDLTLTSSSSPRHCEIESSFFFFHQYAQSKDGGGDLLLTDRHSLTLG